MLYQQITYGIKGITHHCLNVGRIEGGTNTDVVPSSITFKLDCRMIPEENPTEVEATVRRVMQTAAAQCPGITRTIERLLLANACAHPPAMRALMRWWPHCSSTAKRCLARKFPPGACRCTPMCGYMLKPVCPG